MQFLARLKNNLAVQEFAKRFNLKFIKLSKVMPKRRLIGKLKDGQKIIGTLEDYNEDFAVFKDQDENETQLTMFDDLEKALNAGNYDGDIVEVCRIDSSTYDIFVHDSWPEKEKAK